MRIDINQAKISWFNSYKIFIDQKKTHRAECDFVFFTSIIELYKVTSNKPVVMIKKRWSVFKPKYDILFKDGMVAQFRTESIWSCHYYCHFNNDRYTIYSHLERKYSIYKNDIQIAWWDKEAVVWFSGDNYKLTADSDAPIELIISFCLIIDNYFNKRHNGNILTYDFGEVLAEDRKFNRKWIPKEDIL
ncbi:MAG: hypothetical protein JWM14_3429 [Chitinophagaceae bacterium]|nr:hypothetical protein [Chitinophagaceae bacterium]